MNLTRPALEIVSREGLDLETQAQQQSNAQIVARQASTARRAGGSAEIVPVAFTAKMLAKPT